MKDSFTKGFDNLAPGVSPDDLALSGEQTARCETCGFMGNYLANAGCPDCGSQNVVIKA